MKPPLTCAVALVTLLAGRPTLAGPPADFTRTPLANGFDLPTAFAFAPDGRIFVTEKTGRVRVVSGGTTTTFLDVSDEVNEYNDRGLLGIALDPAFASNGLVYLFLIAEIEPIGFPDSGAPAEGKVIRIRESVTAPGVADLATRVTLLQGFDNHHFSHSGGCLRFDPAGRLLASFGDGSSYNEVDSLALHTYDLDSLTGKIVRLDPQTGDGVSDNPYFDPGDPSAVRSKVVARGFRNPFRFGIQPGTLDLWVGDVGWYSWEEVNRVPAVWIDADRDLNFGWPCYEGGTGVSFAQGGYAYDAATQPTCLALFPPDDGGSGVGATPAVSAYPHDESGGENGNSVTGGVFYLGGAYPAAFAGRYFFADYARDRFQTLSADTLVREDFGTPGGWGNPVDLQLAPNGNIAYLAIGEGALYEIRFTGQNRAPSAVATGAPLDGPARLKVRFDGTASSDPDADRLRYRWDFGDGSRTRRGRRPGHIYRTSGTFTVTLTVTDRKAEGLTGVARLTVNVGNAPPTLAFASPSAGSGYAVGDVLAIEVVASDAEDGVLGGPSVTWRALLHHLGHLHYLPGQTGTSGTFRVPDHGDDSFLELEASATDSAGARVTTLLSLSPSTVPVTVDSVPAGATVYLDGQPRVTPFTWQSIVGGTHGVTAAAAQVIGETSLTFQGWSDGGAATHGFVTPAGPLALTATYGP